jgi:hypothetical protein
MLWPLSDFIPAKRDPEKSDGGFAPDHLVGRQP